MHVLCFYAPNEHVEDIKNALFKIGAGKFGNYDNCSWQTNGTGQFRPLSGSNPFIGKKNTTEIVSECRVEMICSDKNISDIIKELIKVHPYEVPSYYIVKNEIPE